MRAFTWLAACTSLALVAVGCRPPTYVRTIVAPDARLSTLHTFSMLRGPARRDLPSDRAGRRADDPMLSNSIAHRAIRDRIVQSFQSRGYVLDDVHPDFEVAFYTSSREKLDVTEWDYGYPFYPPWYGRRRVRTVTEYTEGTVIVDAVDARTHELLWRGEGRGVLSDEPDAVVRELADAAERIVHRFPRATDRVVSERP